MNIQDGFDLFVALAEISVGLNLILPSQQVKKLRKNFRGLKIHEEIS